VKHGVTRSGSTIHYVDGEFDTGKVLAQSAIEVGSSMSPQQLFYRLGELGGDQMVEVLRKFSDSKQPIKTISPEHNKAYYKYFSRWKWDRKKLRINWTLGLREIHYFILANTQESYRYIGPETVLNRKSYFIRRTRLEESVELEAIPSEEDSEIGVLFWRDDELCIGRKAERTILVIQSIQKSDRYFKYRRSNTPRSILGNKNLKIEYDQIEGSKTSSGKNF
jgi:methionyl-tRNA formyltransferase